MLTGGREEIAVMRATPVTVNDKKKGSVRPILDGAPRGTRTKCGVNGQSRVYTDASVPVPSMI